jgi:hypothetical protein
MLLGEPPSHFVPCWRTVVRRGLGAVAGALQYSEILAPRAHGITVLVGHHPGDLVQVSQVVGRPGNPGSRWRLHRYLSRIPFDTSHKLGMSTVGR